MIGRQPILDEKNLDIVREKLTETVYKTSEAYFHQIMQKKYQVMLWKETNLYAQSMILRNEH